MKSQFTTLLIIALLISPGFLKAQESISDSTEFAFLPALSYNSDLGLIVGGLTSWYNYKDGVHPFYSYTTVAGVLSTRGLASFSVLYDKPQAFGKDIRITTQIFASRFFEDAYFGIANYDKITDTPEGLPDYYEFQSFSLGFSSKARLPLIKTTQQKQLDANFVINFRYETPWENGEDRLITREAPVGVEGGRTSMLGAGLIWEGRNSEFQPEKGNYLEARIEVGQEIWGSSYNHTVFETDFRQYFTFFLIREITFASRLSSRFTAGDVPYWKLSYAGDEETLRGYNSRRFSDDNSLLLNNELRTWLFSLPGTQAKFGGTLFVDAGRTFSNGDSIDIIFNDLKTTFGFGTLASFFTPDFIIRGDFGFSDEGLGVYFTTGFMF